MVVQQQEELQEMELQSLRGALARVKLMSQAQTAALKATLVRKLRHRDEVLAGALEMIKEDGAAVDSLRAAATALSKQTESLEISDEVLSHRQSAEVQHLRKENEDLVAEIGKLRKRDGSSESCEESLETYRTEVSKLEKQNAKLLALLQDVRGQMAGSSAEGGGLPTPERRTPLTEVTKVQPPAIPAESGMHSAIDDSPRVQELKEELKALQAALSESKAKVDKLKKSRKEAEKEKVELMEAATREIDQLEKDKVSQLRILKKEVKALKRSRVGHSDQMQSLMEGVRTSRAALQDLRQGATNMEANMQGIARDTSLAIQRRLKRADADMITIRESYGRELKERKRLFNLVQELRGNIRVLCRCRPPTQLELEEHAEQSTICASYPEENRIELVNERNRRKAWEFDRVFGTDIGQAEVYQEVSSLVVSLLDGFNVCIFAYGQTGSGKTYTMVGSEQNRGVNMRALEELFEQSTARREIVQDKIDVSILEIYNETIQDLLVDGSNSVGSKKLEVRQGEHGNHVPDLTLVPVEDLASVMSLMKKGDENRSSACTNMNEHSSRSHLILSVHVTSRNLHTGLVTRGKLHLVDLAGSERISKSGATGQSLKEAQNINKSLSALGDVIAARAQKQAHVPFRNSTLTYLLQDALSQDSKTLMLVCISPVIYNAEESFCSLNFASRVRTVELGKATRNIVDRAACPSPSGTPSPMSRKSHSVRSA